MSLGFFKYVFISHRPLPTTTSSNKDLRVLVIGNYIADNQQSMRRYAELLVRIYNSHAHVCLAFPRRVVTRLLPPLPIFLQKYLGYIDKLFIFPLWLLLNSRHYDLVHIADHGNSYYVYFCPNLRCIVTCHDKTVRQDRVFVERTGGIVYQSTPMDGENCVSRFALPLLSVGIRTHDPFGESRLSGSWWGTQNSPPVIDKSGADVVAHRLLMRI